MSSGTDAGTTSASSDDEEANEWIPTTPAPTDGPDGPSTTSRDDADHHQQQRQHSDDPADLNGDAATSIEANGDNSSVTPKVAHAHAHNETASIRRQVDESIHLSANDRKEQNVDSNNKDENNSISNDLSIPNILNTTITPPLLHLLRILATASLNTTGKVLAPPIHLTRTFLLPTLYESITDHLNTITPTRVKDWFGIFQKGLHHLWGVIISSPTGQRFRGQVYQVGGDVVDVAATPTARQAVVDLCATTIKIAEALHTPEVRSLLHHMSVMGCRMVDAASTGQVKKLMHDLSDVIWSGVELLADENTAVAVAEVTAYLCHALEMEHSLYRDPHHRHCGYGGVRDNAMGENDGDAAVGEEEARKRQRARAARRRRERARQNARTYGPDRDTIDTGGDDDDSSAGGVAIEKAILSSLGDAYRIYGSNDEEGEDGAAASTSRSTHHADLSLDPCAASSLPSRVIVDDDGLGNGLEPPSTDIKGKRTPEGDDASSINTERTGIPIGGDEETKAFADDACDVEFLRKQIARRARTMEVEQIRNRRDESMVDIEDTLSVQPAGEAAPASAPRNKPPSSVSQFYKRVEQVSTQRQSEAIDNILREQDEGGESTGRSRHWYSKAAAAAGAGNEHGQDTIKSRFEAYVSKKSKERGDIGVGVGRDSKATNAQISVRSRVLVLILVLWFLLGCAVMGGFSCYGIYIYFFAANSAPSTGTISKPLSLKKKIFGWRGAAPEAVPAPTEIVIKIVREVVHVAPDGSRYTLPSEKNGDNVDIEAVEEKIAEAATNAIQQAARTHTEL